MKNYLFRKFREEKLLYTILIGFLVVAIILSLVKDFYFINSSNAFEPAERGKIILYHLFSYIIVLGIQMIFIVGSTTYFLKHNFEIITIVISHLFLSILSGIFSYWLILLLSIFVNVIEKSALTTYNHADRIFATLDVNYLIYFAILSVVFLYHYFKKSQEAQLEKSDVENRLVTANLDLLRSQLEPHFLFNSLNTVSSLIHTDQDKAVETLSDLGNVLRDILMLRDKQFISLNQELDYLEKFIKLLQARFENQISFSINVSDQSRQVKVPALILQPIIENAIKHGLKGDVEFIHILILADVSNGNLSVEIKNSGKKIKPAKNYIYSLNKGIELTQERLELSFGKNYSFELKNIDEETYSVMVKMQFPVL